MKIIIGKDELLEGLQRVYSVVPQKPTLPVLSNFLLRVDAGSLFISGTDMDMSITTSLKCTVEGEEAVTVNAKRFLSIISELPEGDVTIIIEDESVTVEFEKGRSRIMGMASAFSTRRRRRFATTGGSNRSIRFREIDSPWAICFHSLPTFASRAYCRTCCP